VNYASNEAMALEVVEEIKARTATNGMMIAIISIILFIIIHHHHHYQ
jgi:hypothetical protein